jgi:perosamine synthetase
MTNICAAIGLAQLEQATDILAKKRQVADWYRDGLQSLPLICHSEMPQTVHSYWMCSIAVDDPAHRNPLRQHLKQEGIETRPLFFPSHTMPHCLTNESFPVAESLASRGINLPSFPELTNSQIKYICNEIKNFLKNYRI